MDRAAQWGIETEYYDASGRYQRVPAETISRLVETFSAGGQSAARLLPRTIVIRRPREIQLHIEADGARLHWEISGDGHHVQGEGHSPLVLPTGLPFGTYQFRLSCDNGRQEEATLLVVPERAYQGDAQTPRRLWALAVQLYGVRSERNWGHGDFTDLAGLIDLAADHGAAAIGLNPLHAMFEDRDGEVSPYYPNSRLFLNPLYIDVDAVPEFSGLRDAGLEQDVETLRHAELVDHAGVARMKMQALRMAYEKFCSEGRPERRAAFQNFWHERGALLTRFACFELLRRRLKGPWWEWPPEWQNPDDATLNRLQQSDREGVGFYAFLQWIAHEQLMRCCERIRERRLPIGLYLDIAVGVRPDGFDAWSESDTVMHSINVGAPPDALNTAGQNWGLAGINPFAFERRRFEPYRRMLQASMRYAGAIRLDHVLGLKRLYLIPQGMQAHEGGYVNFPFEALLAVTTQESVARQCIVVGEDLGTVPEGFRETLADWGIWSYQVMMFERDRDGGFMSAQSYRENALVTFTTHDLPTFSGWVSHHDLAVKRAIGLDPGETDAQRDDAYNALKNALSISSSQSVDFAAVAKYLAGTPSRLLIVGMEDLLGLQDQPNVPGTVHEHPNWRRRLPVSLEELKSAGRLASIAEIMKPAGRDYRQG
jgi:4-alpha-glucanotransferase